MVSQPIPFRKRVFLLGFMGTGKTTIGLRLAQRLGWSFLDLDETIETRQRRTINQIFTEEGEDGFRRQEQAVLRAILSETEDSPAVIALGGGTFAQAGNNELIRSAGGVTVWLDCPLPELRRRCQGMNNRPLFHDAVHFKQLFRLRLPFYRKADFRVDSSPRNPSEVVEEILRCIPF